MKLIAWGLGVAGLGQGFANQDLYTLLWDRYAVDESGELDTEAMRTFVADVHKSVAYETQDSVFG